MQQTGGAMCGSVSAIGLQEHEREVWPELRERLRVPGHLMALMRGVLGDAEVAIVVAVTPKGTVKVVALLATTEAIINEIHIGETEDGYGVRPGTVGGYDVQVVTGEWPDGRPRPLAVLTTPWIEQHLLLYARSLWRGR